MDGDKFQAQIDNVLADIDDRGAPTKMTKDEWTLFLEHLIEALQARLDAAKEGS